MTEHFTRSTPARRFAWVPAAAAAVLSLALYAVTLRGTYIYDDCAIILDDPRIADPWQWRSYLTEQYLPDAPDNLYRPLISLSYAIQWRLHGDRAWAFHLVNWLLAAAAAAAVAEFTRRIIVSASDWRYSVELTGRGFDVPGSQAGKPEMRSEAPAHLYLYRRTTNGVFASLVAGLLFAAHPIHVEAIAGIVGRAELVSTLATFVGLSLFLRRPLTGFRAAAIVACFFAALLSKEQGILFPPLLAALALVREPRRALSPRERARNKWLTLILIWLSAAYLLFREHILKFEWNRGWLSWPANPLVRSTGADRWLMPFVLMGRYAALLVAPYKQSMDYGSAVIGSNVRYHEPYLYLGLAATVAWLVGFALCVRYALRRERRSPQAGAAAFALLGLGLSFGMVSNLTALIGTIFGERLAYMPSAFLAVLVGIAVDSIAARINPASQTRLAAGPQGRMFAGANPFRTAIIAATIILVVLGSFRTVTYASQWNSRLAFYTRQVAEQPKSVRLYALLYREYVKAGDWQSALAVGERCRKEVPQWWESWAMCFEPEMHLGRLEHASALMRQAYKVCRNDALIGWMGLVAQKLDERNAALATQPATQPTMQPVN